MSQEETLRMVAKARGDASGPLRKVENALKALSKRGREETKELHEGFRKVHEQLDRVAEVAREGVAPALGVIGISSLTAVGAVAALVENLRKFADQGASVAAFGRKVQLTTDTIRGLEGAAGQFNVDPEAVRQGEQSFAQAMFLIRRRRGDLYAHLLAQRSDFAQELAATPETVAGNEQALRTFLKLIEDVRRVHGEPTARAFSNEVFGTDAFVDLLRKGNAGLQEAIDLTLKLRGAQDTGAGEKFAAGWARFTDAVEGLRNAVGNELLPDMTALVQQAQEFFSENKVKIGHDIVAAVRGIGGFLRDIKDDLPSIEHGFRDVEAAMQGIAKVWRYLKMTPGQLWTELTGGTVPDSEIRLQAGGGEPPPNPLAPTGSAADRAKQVIAGLRARGLDAEHAAILAGNIQWESNFNPEQPNLLEGGIGLIQWRLDRRRRLQEFAAARGKSETDLATQLDFLMSEINSSAGSEFRSASGMENMNAALHRFIRYGDKSEATRLAYGRALLPNAESAGSLLAAAGQAGIGSNPATVTGNASITVDVKAPPGTKVKADASGLFDTVKVNRGVAMQSADNFE